jgi:hypothetical protein
MLVAHVNFIQQIKNFFLNNCFSGKVPTDTTPDISNPILPTTLINWYNSNSATLTRLNPKLSPTYVNQICSTSIECQHDYIIRINPITSAATASSINTLLQSRVILGKIRIFKRLSFI